MIIFLEYRGQKLSTLGVVVSTHSFTMTTYKEKSHKRKEHHIMLTQIITRFSGKHVSVDLFKPPRYFQVPNNRHFFTKEISTTECKQGQKN